MFHKLSRPFILLSLFMGLAHSQVTTIDGAGATFPYPLYAKWADMYSHEKGVQLNYQSIGSGGGIKQIKARTVDFGASDKPLNLDNPTGDNALDKENLYQFPTIIGGIVLIYNIPNLPEKPVVLSGSVVADIYAKKITKWNDPALVALNPGLPLPDKEIVVVHRSDGSGTTFQFTTYLSKVSNDWKNKVESTIEWPTGIGAKGNEGISGLVKTTPYAIGYVEFAHATENKLKYTSLINKAGKTVEPNVKTFSAAAMVKTLDDLKDLTHQPQEDAWPITGTSYIIMQKKADPEKNKAVLSFFNWAFDKGDDAAESLHYIPLPDAITAKIKELWDHVQPHWSN